MKTWGNLTSLHLSSKVYAVNPRGLVLQMSGPPESPCNREKRRLDAACLLLKYLTYLANPSILFAKFGANHV